MKPSIELNFHKIQRNVDTSMYIPLQILRKPLLNLKNTLGSSDYSPLHALFLFISLTLTLEWFGK